MTDTIKNLAQSAPAAGTQTDVYTVAALTSATVSSLVLCNYGSVVAKVRVSHAKAAAADTEKQRIYYDLSVQPLATWIATIGLTMATADVLRVTVDVGTVAVNVYGVEIT